MKRSRLWLAVVGISCTLFACEQAKMPFQNPELTAEERADDLLSRLTLEEKIALMQNSSPAVERLGIPVYDWWNEALHGVGRAGLATVFPQSIGMAATFDDEAVYKTFDIVSTEARAKHHYFKHKETGLRYQGLTFWTPNINIFRDPRWGRGQETYGEDPYLTGRMGVAVVNGLQGDTTARYDKLHACAKHYAVHSGPEWNRHSFNAEKISPRDLWETYLPAFKELVQEADVKEVMCAYNRYEGKPCCGSDQLLMHILREEWGYKGIVVSDCGAIGDFYRGGAHETHDSRESASADAVLTGTDLECGSDYSALVNAAQQGLISETQIDISLRRLLIARFELGMFDDDKLVEWAQIPHSVVDCKEHRDHALEMARKSMVLLHNKGNLLPLDKNGSIALIGPNATDSTMMWGNYNGFPSHTETILAGILEKAPQTYYTRGCDWVEDRIFVSAFDRCAIQGHTGFAASYWDNTEMSGTPIASSQVIVPPHFDISNADGFTIGVPRYNFSARYNTTFTSDIDGEYTFTISADDGFRIIIDGDTIANLWWDGRAFDNNDIHFPVRKGQNYDITIEFAQGGGNGYMRFDIGKYQTVDADALARSIKEDIVIFACGISPRLEGEEMRVKYPGFRGGDRDIIELPEIQHKVIKALKKAGKKVVLVLSSGSAIGLERELPMVDAIVQAWYPGQAGGTAIADVLFGDYNPAGRLPVTFYKSTAQLPDFENYDMTGRTYRYMREAPLFAFGHGLSYTTFDYGKASLTHDVEADKENALNVTLTNSGTRDGDEVIQVYVRYLQDTAGPTKSLRAFKRVHLKAGETRQVEIPLRSSTFEFFDPQTNVVWCKPGKYEILYGGSSADKALKSFTVSIK
ncbi:MAG: glycoside hydrolase family 3 C-terminal domain-containing protein [Coprobacter sp.]|nr:glycoside hydrolase family 3 C-terminal domain-containing protein [Coprobacter sp.]